MAIRDIQAAELRRLQEEEAYRLMFEKHRYYTPNGKCEEFISKIGGNDFFIVLFSAANGVGKTAAGANIIAEMLFPSHNPYFDYDLFKNFPYPKRIRIASDPTNVEKNIIPALHEWLPGGRNGQKYTTGKGNKKYDSIWKADDWEMDIMTYEQDAMEYEGATLGFAWFDEPPPEAIFKATVARMRKGGIIMITATPLSNSAWMYDNFMTGNYTADMGGKALTRKVSYVEADVESACKTHGVRGHLEHNHIEAIIAEYSEDERQARIYGKFQHLVGIVFKQFEPKIHVIKPFDVNPKDFVVVEALDPHPRNPDAVLWVAIDKHKRKFIVDELFVKCTHGAEELATRIKEKASHYRILRRIADPSAFIEDQHTNKSLASRLAEYGISYIEASKARMASDRRIGDALSFHKIPSGEFIKAPEIYVFDTCRRMIWEFSHYRWADWTGKGADNREPKEKTLDKDDHMVENLGRILLMEPEWQPHILRKQASQSINYDPFDAPMA